MNLKEYNKKRRFDKTPEPKGKKGKSKISLPRFVVQEHHATRLHYDFRLELGGVLVSWAVPKGPSMNPADKRLAMKVEDHPLSYYNFEGVIPKGNYGAGKVSIWDKGFYHWADTNDHNENERKLKAGLYKGHIDFLIAGEKLQGLFSLIKMKDAEENAWLLIKQKDEFAHN